MHKLRPLIFVTLALCCAQPGRAVDTNSQGENPDRQESPSATQEAKDPDLESVLRKQMHTAAEVPRTDLPDPEEPTSPFSMESLALLELLALSALVSVLFGFRIVRFLHKVSDAPQPVSDIELFSNLLAEDESFGNFMTAMKEGPQASAPEASAEASDASAPGTSAAKKSGPLELFFEAAPKRIAMARKIFSEFGRAGEPGARQKILEQIACEVGWLKNSSSAPELLPAWQMAAALEGLFGQLTRNASNVTPSALRTAAGALDLLQDLCVPGVKPNLTKKPPVRLLVVDDDAISRNAVSLALRKIFPEPELADGGEAALVLAKNHTYDVVFLDVEMPGMDGFELCSKIHDTLCNHAAPVVFVTRHSDFAARAKSTLSGGEDLIGKPFLAFEITVKALTLVLRGRLQRNGATLPSAGNARSFRAVLAEPFIPKEAPPAPPSAAPSLSISPDTQLPVLRSAFSTPEVSLTKEVGEGGAPGAVPSPVSLDTRHSTLDTVPAEPSAAEFASAFFTHAPAHLEEIQNQLHMARNAPKPTDLSELLGELYVGVHSIRCDAERAELQALSKLGSSLEGMLKKLLENPKLCTPSTLDTAAAALELLEKLCRARSNPDLTSSPIRLLVVDDDPVARRGIGGCLQLVLGRPDSADSGEAALTLAAQKAFDLIFLDVLMPGMDGFTTCLRIHETVLNRLTPVVFVTNHHDLEARSQAAASGGCGFIPKPVLSSQITLTALTFVLGRRLEKPGAPRVAAPVPEAVS